MKFTHTCLTCSGLGELGYNTSVNDPLAGYYRYPCESCSGYGVVDICEGCGADFDTEDEALNTFGLCFPCETVELDITEVN